jgi:hypothetical protein
MGGMATLLRPPWSRPGRGVVAAFSVVLLSATTTFAQSPSNRPKAAEKLFEEGRRLVAERRFAAACPKFAASKALEAGIGVSLWLADCYESNGQTASAWGEFVATADFAGERGDPREAVARGRAEALLPRLSRIVLVTPPVADDAVEVLCDGSPVPPTRWVSGFYVDPGMHHLRASTGGRPFWEADIDVGPVSDVQTLTLPSAPPLQERRTIPVVSPPVSSDRPPSSRPSRASMNVAAASSAGLGLVALGLGTYFGLEAKHDNDASGSCGMTFCSQAAHDLRTDALHNATAADVAFAVGAAAILGGVVFYLVGRGRGVPSSSREALFRLAF